MAPLSCKFVLFLIVLSKSNEVISDWLGLDNLFAIFQVHGYEKSSQLLPKTIKNWATLHEMGGHYLVATLYCSQKWREIMLVNNIAPHQSLFLKYHTASLTQDRNKRKIWKENSSFLKCKTVALIRERHIFDSTT